MSTLFQSVCAMLIGLAMVVFGTIHALTQYPGVAGFTALWASMPALTAVAWFLLGLIAVVAGVVLVVRGVRGLRRRLRQVRAALDGPRFDHDVDDEPDWGRVHPYQ